MSYGPGLSKICMHESWNIWTPPLAQYAKVAVASALLRAPHSLNTPVEIHTFLCATSD
jgi:hypothetical protein